MKDSLVERLLSHAHPEPMSGCWLWDASTTRFGYGRLGVERRVELAHRVAFRLLVEPIPPGLYVLHSCDVAPCVNPEHLYLGTHRDNMDDMKERGRVALGARHSQAKLTADDVLSIREMVADGAPQHDIAEAYGISQGHVSNIARRVVWGHL